jgi:hypothetical protein
MTAQANIQRLLAPAAMRLKLNAVLRALARGLFFGAGAAFVVALARSVLDGWLTVLLAAGVAILVPLGFALVALFRGSDWRAAARATDDAFHLHDAALTALSASSPPTPLEQLHAERTLAALQQRPTGLAVPLAFPRSLLVGAGLSLAAVGLTLLPLSRVPDFVRLSTESSDAQAPGQVQTRPFDLPPGAAPTPLPSAQPSAEQPDARLEEGVILRRYFAPEPRQ